VVDPGSSFARRTPHLYILEAKSNLEML